jgi:hypothetical protein
MMGEKILTASWKKADWAGKIRVSFYTFDR